MGKFRIISEFLYLTISIVVFFDYLFKIDDERKNFILIFELLSFFNVFV